MGGRGWKKLWERVGSSRRFCRAHHFRLDRVVEHHPCLLYLCSERRTKLLSQAPYQCVAKRNKMRGLYSELRVLAARVADDGLEYFTLIERADDRGDRIHQLELLPFHIVREQASCIGREFEESTVEQLGEFATEWPQRVERFPDEINLLGRHRIAPPLLLDHSITSSALSPAGAWSIPALLSLEHSASHRAC